MQIENTDYFKRKIVGFVNTKEESSERQRLIFTTLILGNLEVAGVRGENVHNLRREAFAQALKTFRLRRLKRVLHCRGEARRLPSKGYIARPIHTSRYCQDVLCNEWCRLVCPFLNGQRLLSNGHERLFSGSGCAACLKFAGYS